MRLPENTVLETHFGIQTLFPKGIKHDGMKIELSRFVREGPTEPSNGATDESIGEQGSAGQPATRSESDSEGDDKPQPESEGRSR